MTTYEVTYKRLSTSLRVHWRSPNGDGTYKSGAFKLTLPQWHDLTHLVQTEADPKQPKGTRRLRGWMDSPHSSEKFRAKGLIYDHKYQVPGTNHWNRGQMEERSVTNIITDFGEAVLAAIPKCPERKTWPVSSGSPEARSPENIKLTGPQRQILQKWPRERTWAVPVGGMQAEESRWVPDGYRGGGKHGSPSHPRVSIAALMQMGLVEPGVSGVALENGTLVFTAPGTPDVGLVYRMTIRGALIGGET